jgi:hypothetical protein
MTHTTHMYGGFPDCYALCSCGWSSTHEAGFYGVIQQVLAHEGAAAPV